MLAPSSLRRWATHPLGQALAVAAALFVLDLGLRDHVALIGAYIAVPLLVAARATPPQTLVAATIAFALALVSAVRSHGLLDADDLAAVAAVAVGGVLAANNSRLRQAQGEVLVSAEHARVVAEHEREVAEDALARMAVLADVGRAAAETVTVADAAARLADALVPRIADLCTIEVGHDEAARRAALRWSGPGGAELAKRLEARPLSAQRSTTLVHARPGEAVLNASIDPDRIAASATDDEDRALLASLGLRSSIAVALTAGGRPVGSLALAVGPSGRTYDEDDLAFVEVLAGRVGLALGNVQLFEELTATREQLDQTLATLAEAVTVTDGDRRIRYANQAAADLLGYPSPEAMIETPTGTIAADWISTHEDGRPLAPEDIPSWRIVNGLPAEPLLTHVVNRATGSEHWRLVKAAPLRGPDGELLAVSVIEDVTEAKEAELRAGFLARTGEILTSSLEYEDTLRRVAQLAVPTLADWCAVDVLDARGVPTLVAVAHVDPDKVAFARRLREVHPPDPTDELGLFGVLRTGEPTLYETVDDELLEAATKDPEQLEGLRRLGLRSVMIVPMAVAGRTIGAMTFVSAESARTFDEQDLEFAGEIARRAAIAIENSRLYTERTQTALTLQDSLLPVRLPRIPGWRIASSYAPGDDAVNVGGDFYDVVELDHGFLVIIGDVTGKGVAAAALTAKARHTLATAARFDPSPPAVVRLLNDVLIRRPALALLTAVCAHVAPTATGARLRLTCAGHPLPLLLREGEPPRPLGRPNVLIGAVPHGEWHEEVVDLGPDDTLLFYTDGITDTPGSDGRFGTERLLDVVAGAPIEPGALIEHVTAALRTFERGGALDDRALLALQLVDDPATEPA